MCGPCDPWLTMARLKEECICVKACCRHGNPAPETQEMLKTAIGDNFMGKTRAFDWLFWFKREETSVESCDLQGSPSTGGTDETVQKVGKIINEDRWRPMPEITGRLGLSYGICQWILRVGLNVWKICARFVPRLLTNETQQRAILRRYGMAVVPILLTRLVSIFCFFLFPRMKQFPDAHWIQEQSLTVLQEIPKKKSQFYLCFLQRHKPGTHCINSKEGYFERNKDR